MPVRRSARLKSLNTAVEETPTESPVAQSNVNKNKQNRLGTVVEREEPSTKTQTTPTTPAKTQTNTPKATHIPRMSPTKTPTTSVTRPDHFEMHPSKAHQSTTKQPDSGLVLGFKPVKKDAQGNIVKETPAQNTPSKTNQSPASAYYGTPALDFKFSCEDSQLSDEAKKLMESLREDVARIKANMIHEKVTNAVEPEQSSSRKIAKPKGKSGRFSDAHMAEFKKMDSIANHPSAFRATPEFRARKERLQSAQKTLKRTNSKARLDETETQNSARATPKASTPTATPAAKRVKQNTATETATETATPSRLTGIKSAMRPRSSIRSSLLTPTRSSIARASSLKPPRTSMIPSFARSPLSKPAEVPTTPRTEFNPRFKSNIPTLSSLKSILRPHQPLFSKDPSKIAAGTHQTAPDFTPDLLLQPSRETSHEPTATPSPKKRVEFTPCTKPRQAEEVISPSPSKNTVAITYPSTCDVVYPTLPTLTPERGSARKPTTIRPIRPSEAPVEATLPEIPGMPHGLSHKKRHRATEDEADRENVPPADEASQERSAKRVKMSSPSKMIASSPLKSRSRTPLRPSAAGIRKGTPGSARPKSGMSLSRLNMLAQPKNRS
ncbi:hypothetical protein BJY04DRAFT_203607 [Aspergillus karnatakaensis]|uniref:uncharacterized protein n=1 Tax=Aspergillus karnatakaensis TaxID=1810916 RepID=UPI003CCD49A1